MAAAPSVLVIEDNHDIAQMVCDSLEQAGYVVDYAGDGVSGLHLAVSGSFDAIILDLMLPGMDGLELCRKLRRDAGKDTPVLMLTARDTLEDKIAGLDAGADDYLVKPFDLRELDARLRAMIRRFSGRMVDEVLSLGDLRVDTGTMEVERGGRRITLTPIAFTILLTLLKASPRIVARRDLERAVWGEVTPDSDALRSHLYTLRKAIDKPFPTPLLHTVAGRGYRLAVLDED
ncbi:MAG: response regulator transcription factor [Gammaproteobacteria bacterium]